MKRGLEDFVEDAKGADVALIYYSGHGIEAGGENFLVPIDADLSSLDDAGDRLVPLNAIVERLQRTVPVVIVLLDACRTDPFPPGVTLRPSSDAAPVTISASGLGGARGATGLVSRTDDGRDNLGTVIGFSAAPGQAALDGDPGGNGPYSAAVLKHLDAMPGEEFGAVMRMVAEEVYLRTDGRQRPWVNESLRRLLYFGNAPQKAQGERSDILTERRQQLLTIAGLSDHDRRQVETAAAENHVPMDALYAMLKALGSDVPKDAADLERLLRSRADKVRTIMAERAALTSADPEIQRLAGLADDAIHEDGLATAIALNQRAKARFGEIAPHLDKAEADLKARRIEAANVYIRSAQAYDLAADYRAAANDYGAAFLQVERWDSELAWGCKLAQAAALHDQGYYRADNGALAEAIAVTREALAMTPADKRPDDWASMQNNLGIELSLLGERESDTKRLEQAAAAFRAALEVRTRDHAPPDWALTQSNLASVLRVLAERRGDVARLRDVAGICRAALEEFPRESAPLDWARTQSNLGNVLLKLGEREHDTSELEAAIAVYRSALEERTRERAPLDWAQTQNNLGAALEAVGERNDDVALLRDAVTAYRSALEERTRERVPLDWAMTQYNLGNALASLGEQGDSTGQLRYAVEAYRSAQAEFTRERAPLRWAETQRALGAALLELGKRSGKRADVEQARTAFAAVQEAYRASGNVQYESYLKDKLTAVDRLLTRFR